MSLFSKTDLLNKSINEIWATVPGSYEEAQLRIRRAIEATTVFGVVKNTYDVSLEATTKSSIIVSKQDEGRRKPIYYSADWDLDDDDNVVFSNVKEVKLDAVMKVKNEALETFESIMNESKSVILNELITTDIMLYEAVDKNGKAYKRGRVKKANVANEQNANGREYPTKVLDESTKNINERIEKYGAQHMDSQHRVKDGKNHRDVRETVALMDGISFDGKQIGIEFALVETEAGKDFTALIDGGARFQVSQRATGKSHLEKLDDGKVKEVVDTLNIESFDFVPAGTASVSGSDVEFFSESIGGREMAVGNVMTREEVEVMLKAERENIVAGVVEAFAAQQEAEAEEEEEEEEVITPLDTVVSEQVQVSVDPKLLEQVNNMQKQVAESQVRLDEMKRKETVALMESGKIVYLNEIASGDPYKRFTVKQKETMINRIKVEDLSDLHEVTSDGFKAEVKKRFDNEVENAIALLADNTLQRMGYTPGSNNVNGQSVVVVNEAKPWMETVDKLYADVLRTINRKKSKDAFYIGDDHPAMAMINRMCEGFEEKFYHQLMNETAADVLQADIGVKVATISRTVIPAAFRFITAFDVCDVGNQASRIENIMYQVWNGSYTAGRPDLNVGAIEIAESGTIPLAGIQYVASPLATIRKTKKTTISSEARATAMGTSMNPVADSIAHLAIDVTMCIDELLWYLMITTAQMYAHAHVTSFEHLTEGDNNEWASVNQGWMQYEYVKTFDTPGNPLTSRLVPLFGTVSGNTFQEVVVQERDDAGGDGTDLVYGDDYSVNWADGTITLTAAGIVKENGFGIEAKYSYTTNSKFWSVIPPTGVSGYENLVNLRQAVGQSRVLVNNRHYNANMLGMSFATEDMITSGPMFTQAGGTPADIMDRLNKVTAFAGLDPTKTSAMPNAWILVGEKGSCYYRNQIPWNVTGPFKDTTTGNDEWIGEEYSGQDVPVPAKLALVGVTDLATTV